MKKRRIPKWVVIAVAVGGGGLVLVLAGLLALGWYVKNQMLDSGGALSAAQAAYDVRHYRIEVGVDPPSRTIEGVTTVTVEAIAPLSVFELDLDSRLTVRSVRCDGWVVEFSHEDGVIVVDLADSWSAGERHEVEVAYGGAPKVALRAPWIDGFVWAKAPSGAPWIGVTGQGDGGDNWWPCKDHPSDEPDEGMTILLTVPDDLVGLSNGRKVGESDNGDGTVTTEWVVSYPINNYLVTLNIAPYVAVEAPYRGVDGTLDETLVFWAVPEFEDRARAMWLQMPKILEVLGKRFGEYPFFEDKMWVAHAPYLGMEHQTLVAYGAEFTDNAYGFDELLLHEVAHEWWGNKVTASDWADFWLHEGFATYAEAVYVLDTLGEGRYLDYMSMLRGRIRNQTPLVQGEDLTSAGAYSGDIYVKGAWVLHSLRWLLGDEDFWEVLWRFANDERFAYGLVANEDLFALVAEVSGRDDLGWFWQRYLFEAKEPRCSIERAAAGDHDLIRLRWHDPSFEMPLPVQVGEVIGRVDMWGGEGSLEVARGATVIVDPEGRVLASPAE